MDGSWEYHMKWNRSDGKGQKLHDFTSLWKVKQTNKTEQTHRYKQQNGGY